MSWPVRQDMFCLARQDMSCLARQFMSGKTRHVLSGKTRHVLSDKPRHELVYQGHLGKRRLNSILVAGGAEANCLLRGKAVFN